MRNIFSLKVARMLILLMDVSMMACTDEIEEMGPSGTKDHDEAFTNGFIKGSVSGARKDGEAFSGSFDYTKPEEKVVVFYQDPQNENVQDLYLGWGNGTVDYTEIYLSIEGLGTASEKATISSFELMFSKPLVSRELFALSAESDFEEDEIVFPVSPDNIDYKFIFDFSEHSGFIQFYKEGMDAPLYYIKDEDGNSIYFEHPYADYGYDDQGYYYDYGGFAYLINKDGGKTTASEKYGQLTVRRKDNGGWAIYDGNGTDLSGAITITDQQSITNFQYDENTGDLSFDYEITINKYNRGNSSANEVTVKGQVEVTVDYKKVISEAPQHDHVF